MRYKLRPSSHSRSDVPPISAAATLCNRLRAALSARALHVEDQVTTLTVSMGFSEVPPWPGTSADWQLAMRIADAALYECKSSGRDRWLGYTAGSTPDADAISKADVAELVAALKTKGLV